MICLNSIHSNKMPVHNNTLQYIRKTINLILASLFPSLMFKNDGLMLKKLYLTDQKTC